ncbi:hydrogenase maturation protease [Kutzneria kofuensis]|uniref:hydrogenase maturation protease n=1 Tax=Kutzneria kofuensis TaxID=103725 RepID=UPI0028A9569A|nr:hydrogenase maturation protease [Kutzneria kofuensis]
MLIAGVGNIFLGDDGFGVEVARRLSTLDLPDGVQVRDYGVSGMHLAFDLLDSYDTTILVDATCRGDAPGTVYVVELDPVDEPTGFIDAHGMQPDVVMQLLAMLGGSSGRVLLVGCEPASVTGHIGLSPAVAGAVDAAVRTVLELVEVCDVPGDSR